MFYDVIDVQPIEYLRLQVTFKDQTKGEVILSEKFLTGVFSQLKKIEIFNKVSCKNGFVEWPGELDLAPDAMYEAIVKNGSWLLE